MTKATVNTINKVYPMVDIAKFICAILVIGIHTEPFAFNFLFDKGFGLVTRLAVPFFFISSSYFLFTKWSSDHKFSVKPYINRIVTTYFIWSLIYLPFKIFSWIKSEVSLNNIVVSYIKDIFINGTYAHLWFLPSLIIGIVLVGLLLRFLEIKRILLISLIIFCIGIMFSTYLPVTKIILKGNIDIIQSVINYIGTRNGLFYAFPYVALGAWLSINKSIIRKIAMRKWVIGFFVSMFSLGAESIIAIFFIHSQATILWFSVIPATISLFGICLKSQSIKAIAVTAFLRKASILMYTSHYLFIILFANIFKQIDNYVLYHPLLFTCVMVATIALSVCIVKASDKIRILKLLY